MDELTETDLKAVQRACNILAPTEWNRILVALSQQATRIADLESQLKKVRGLAENLKIPQLGDDCTLYTMGRRAARCDCSSQLTAILQPASDEAGSA